MNNFANRLEMLIKENKTKKKVLAAAIGMSASSITEMVKGRNNSTTPTIRAIAGFYHVNPEWLEHGTGEIMEPVNTINIENEKNARLKMAYELLNEESDEELEDLIFKLLQKKKTRSEGLPPE